MRILFDQGTPVPLRSLLVGHLVLTAHERRWSRLSNGDLIAAAEGENFDVLVTTDRNLKYQQNLSDRSIAIPVLSTTSRPRIQAAAELVVTAVGELTRGRYVELEIP
jgi:hypothetical protein